MNAERIASIENSAEKADIRGRHIFLLDIENYAGKAVLGSDDVDAVRESVER